jgi:hypothetical protein
MKGCCGRKCTAAISIRMRAVVRAASAAKLESAVNGVS